MSTETPISVWEEPVAVLDRLEARLRAMRQLGLTVWVGVLRRVFGRVNAQREAVYRECMLMEMEVEAGRDSLVILNRLAKIKGLVAAVLLGLCLYQCVEHFDDQFARRGGGRNVRVVRVARGKRKGEGNEDVC